MSAFSDDIVQQPNALRDVTAFYRSDAGRALLDSLPNVRRIVLTGMGASYHAAWIASFHLQSLNIPAVAVEATDLLNYSGALLNDIEALVFISQSGASGEVNPITEKLSPSTLLIGVTNQPDSPLGKRATITLPIHAGEETYVASKTYLNTLAVVWLMARKIGGRLDADSFAQLDRVVNASETLITNAEKGFESVITAPRRLFVGHGLHAATARHCAMMMAEWAKQTAFSAGLGAFRHGFIEMIEPDCAVVIFGAGGRTRDSSAALAHELRGYGAQVLPVFAGNLTDVTPDIDEFLTPILDTIPIQWCVEKLARDLGITPGFRYISKVVSQL